VWVRSLAQEYGRFRNRWGMAASPLLVDDLLVVQVDHWGGSYLLAVDPATGSTRWRTARDPSVGWSSPVAWKVGPRTQIVATGNYTLKGYDSASGKELWSFRGLHMQCIPTPVVHRGRLFLCSGEDFTSLCFRPEAGKPRLAWKAPSKGANVPSPVCLGDHYYFVEDAGWANCLRADSGERVWRERLGGSKYSASPVAADGKLYLTSEDGDVFVVKAGASYAPLATNHIGQTLMATPAISEGTIIIRGLKDVFAIRQKS
jgi:outer membrane protein assembly factor BamB